MINNIEKISRFLGYILNRFDKQYPQNKTVGIKTFIKFYYLNVMIRYRRNNHRIDLKLNIS